MPRFDLEAARQVFRQAPFVADVEPGRQLMFTEAEVHCESADGSRLVATFSATMAVTGPQ